MGLCFLAVTNVTSQVGRMPSRVLYMVTVQITREIQDSQYGFTHQQGIASKDTTSKDTVSTLMNRDCLSRHFLYSPQQDTPSIHTMLVYS